MAIVALTAIALSGWNLMERRAAYRQRADNAYFRELDTRARMQRQGRIILDSMRVHERFLSGWVDQAVARGDMGDAERCRSLLRATSEFLAVFENRPFAATDLTAHYARLVQLAGDSQPSPKSTSRVISVGIQFGPDSIPNLVRSNGEYAKSYTQLSSEITDSIQQRQLFERAAR